MQFRDLQHFSLQTLADTFNLAFSDYLLPMHFTEAQLIQKLTRDGINLEHSVGAFDGEKLVGFILQGLGLWEGQLTAYNGGTGVVPAYRGRKLTQELYAYTIDKLKAAQVKNCLLEVVTQNEVALRNYEKIGFRVARTLESYKGEIKAGLPGFILRALPAGISLREVPDLDWRQAESFWDFVPSWQYNFAALQRARDFTRLIGVYRKEELIGYGAVLENTNRVAQFAIDPAYRRAGLGTHLFRKLGAGKSTPLSVINIDERSESTLNFLEELGLTQFLTQYEMVLAI
ncbi:MAG: hypothetical protein JWQ14_1576 [Adhaeribacter sp.]|nr:hypothetical protein [Adhaeribacter sp.]